MLIYKPDENHFLRDRRQILFLLSSEFKGINQILGNH